MIFVGAVLVYVCLKGTFKGLLCLVCSTSLNILVLDFQRHFRVLEWSFGLVVLSIFCLQKSLKESEGSIGDIQETRPSTGIVRGECWYLRPKKPGLKGIYH